MPEYKPEQISEERIKALISDAREFLENASDEWGRYRASWLLSTLAAVDEHGNLNPRREQLPPPGNWTIWLCRAGRGAGKTRVGAEDQSEFARHNPHALIGFVAPKIAKFRDVMMEGPSGLLNIIPPSAMLGGSLSKAWNRSLGEFYFTNGAKVKGFSAEKPGEPRGYNLHRAWVDEPAEFSDAHIGMKRDSTFSNTLFALRMGDHPQMVVTGTPTKCLLVEELIAHPRCLWVKFSTYRNIANLAPTFVEEILQAYEGTTLGLQEIYAEILDEVEGALWTSAEIDADRILEDDLPPLRTKVVGVDPSMGREAGIVVCGVGYGTPAVGYVLADCSVVGRGAVWGKAAVEAYHEHGCSAMVIETNLPPKEETIATIRSVPGGEVVRIIPVTAHEGKAARAGPVKALSQQRRIKFVGSFGLLESQMTSWVPPTGLEPSPWSPNRLDAFVWACHQLLVTTRQQGGRIAGGRMMREARMPSTLGS